MSNRFMTSRDTRIVHYPALGYFQYGHLKDSTLRDISKKCGELADHMTSNLPHNPETTHGLRKLLEAKDCFVRAALEIEKDG